MGDILAVTGIIGKKTGGAVAAQIVRNIDKRYKVFMDDITVFLREL